MSDLIFFTIKNGRKNCLSMKDDEDDWVKARPNAGMSAFWSSKIMNHRNRKRPTLRCGTGYIWKIKTIDNFFKQSYSEFSSELQMGCLIYKQRTGAKYRQIASLPLTFNFPKIENYDHINLMDCEKIYTMIFKISLKNRKLLTRLRTKHRQCIVTPKPIEHNQQNVHVKVLSNSEASISLDELSLRGLSLKKETDQVFEVMMVFQFEQVTVLSSFVTRQNGQKSKKPIPVSFRLDDDLKVPIVYRIYDKKDLNIGDLKKCYGRKYVTRQKMGEEDEEITVHEAKQRMSPRKVDVDYIDDDDVNNSPIVPKRNRRQLRSTRSKKETCSKKRHYVITPRRSSRISQRTKNQCKNSCVANRLEITTTNIPVLKKTKTIYEG